MSGAPNYITSAMRDLFGSAVWICAPLVHISQVNHNGVTVRVHRGFFVRSMHVSNGVDELVVDLNLGRAMGQLLRKQCGSQRGATQDRDERMAIIKWECYFAHEGFSTRTRLG